MSRESEAGHRALPHTADLAIEAWAEEREECVAQAVQALVESFARLPEDTRPTGGAAFGFEPEDDEDLLVSILDEAVYQVEVHGRVPIDTSIDLRTGVGEGRVDVRFATVPVDRAEPVGAIPKAVSLHALSFAHTGGCWRAHITIDV
jgi:SHS2 domain-containing protein